MTHVGDCRLVQLPKIHDRRGNLSVIEGGRNIPFEIQRVYWIYDTPGGTARVGHAYQQQQEFIVALSGSFDVTIDDGTNRAVFTLNRSYFGLFVAHQIWRTIDSFSTNSVCMILSSHEFSEADYIRDHNEFVKIKRISS